MNFTRKLCSPLLPVFAAAILPAMGCGNDAELVDPDKLCPLGAGIAARVSGTPEAVELCVSNANTATSFTGAPDYRYELTATSVSDSIEITIGMSFQVHSEQPKQLNITSDIAEAFADPDGAWFFYREVKPGQYDYSSASVSGVFTLAISDRSVASGTFTNLQIDLEDTSDGTPSGSRVISEGFFNVTPD